MSKDSFQITANVTMTGNDISISNLNTIDFKNNIKSIRITFKDDNPSEADINTLKENTSLDFKNIEDEKSLKIILFGDYLHVFGNLYMKNNFPAFILFSDNKWTLFFHCNNIFYFFSPKDKSTHFMDSKELNNLFNSNNFYLFLEKKYVRYTGTSFDIKNTFSITLR